MNPSSHPVDESLSDWIEAYGQLKAAQKSVKAAGPKSTLAMRQHIERLRQSAESALKHLQTGSENVTSRAPRELV